ncbi:MAG: hypothetical protein R3C53_25155 [Pirellulaceae bacterium]
MAWGVRCAQLRQRTGLVVRLAITLGCAAMFLGVKAIEYTHKWDMGSLPAGMYVSQYSVPEAHQGLSPWLYKLSAIPALYAVGLAIWYVMTIVQGKKRLTEIAGPLLVTALCYFVGVFIGIAFQNAEAKPHASAHGEHGQVEHADSEHGEEHGEEHGGGENSSHEADEHADTDHGASASQPEKVVMVSTTSRRRNGSRARAPDIKMIDQPAGAGLFFSIYYCMTGTRHSHS